MISPTSTSVFCVGVSTALGVLSCIGGGRFFLPAGLPGGAPSAGPPSGAGAARVGMSSGSGLGGGAGVATSSASALKFRFVRMGRDGVEAGVVMFARLTPTSYTYECLRS